ncbi:unnamed protein product [Moneuplotes crassus]|uniref:Uncharacterized protein n=1 Tax=Euplotes crassus TaxID=5936 RepID=A0AAD1U728_EUPCR|nr:unnamed protein product [Moneuplotes crassus]
MSEEKEILDMEESSEDELPRLEVSKKMSSYPEEFDDDDSDEMPQLVVWNKRSSSENSNFRVKISDKKILGVKFGANRRKTQDIRKNSGMSLQLGNEEAGDLPLTIEEEPHNETEDTQIYEEINEDGEQDADIDLKYLINKLKIEEQLELVHPEIKKTYNDGLKMQQYTPNNLNRLKERKRMKKHYQQYAVEKKVSQPVYQKERIDSKNLEEDNRIKTERIKELQQTYKHEVNSLRQIIKENHKDEFHAYGELRVINQKLSQEIFHLKNQLTSEKYKNERIHREIKDYGVEIKKILNKEIKDLNILKKDLVEQKAKYKYLQKKYKEALERDTKEEGVDQQISRQDSLNKMDEDRMEMILDSKTKEIIELLNKEGESEISPIDENTKTAQNEASFFAKQSMLDEIQDYRKPISNISSLTGNKMPTMAKLPKKPKPSSAFEYEIEENELSYRSSLHPDIED